MPDKMIRCPEGHFYDPAKHNACPWCALPADSGGEDKKTRPVRLDPAPAPPPLPGGGGAAVVPPPIPVPSPAPAPAPPGPGKTVRYRGAGVAAETESDDKGPVVGWLVCVEGPDRGRDFRLHPEKNTIGRSPTMDVIIKNDNSVSREKHGVVIFDPKRLSFWILPGEASGLVYLNGEVVYSPTQMNQDDVLEIGKTKLVLVPFNNEKYNWLQVEGA